MALPQGDDIKDTDIRIIGIESKKKKFPWLWVIVSVIVLVAVVLVLVSVFGSHPVQNISSDSARPEQTVVPQKTHPLADWLSSLDSIGAVGCVGKDTTVNDVVLHIHVPVNCKAPHLEVGYRCLDDTIKDVLFFQAADVRADNMKIVGAFVLQGKPLSWGLSKRGYCGIIDEQVTIGVADNSPLFEQATEKNGYFFRQYPLVDNGVLVENELTTKYTRRALCELEEHVVVIESLTAESLHDFAQALVDLDVQNAIYLVGGSAMGWSRDIDGIGRPSGQWEARVYKNVSFIVWSK